MKIGVDARAAAEERGGRGTVVRELLRAWTRREVPHEIVLYAREPWEEPLGPQLHWQSIQAPDPLWHLGAALRANRECDVFLSTNSYLSAWFLRVPTVVMVYDLIAWRPELRPQRRAAAIERATLPFAVRRAAAFQCDSRSAASDLVAKFPRVGTRAQVVELAADARFRPDGPREEIEGRPYVLGVGAIEPRKNLARLIEAFATLPDDVRDNRLLALAGPAGWETDETMAALRVHSTHVRSLGYVADDRLPGLYRGADLFAYPSIYEGFGLPLLEAMACGTAVLTSDVSSMPEVAAEAAVYVDPADVASIRDGLARALTQPGLRAHLSKAGLRRAQGFSWDRCAEETLALLERVVRPEVRR